MNSPSVCQRTLPAKLDLFQLLDGYRREKFTPSDVMREVLRRVQQRSSASEWTALVPPEAVLAQARQLEDASPQLPLYGIPFAVKDNIHVEGLPTTASCPAFSHLPSVTSPVVQQLIRLGAILIGKNTMDEFATGVVGVRSNPHPVNPFNADYIPGGSSSGSAVVVAKGCVSFALGSDTGGSGRVPAALCNIVGFKPTPHRLSNAGIVYANRSIDCIPFFTRYTREAAYLFQCCLDSDVWNAVSSPQSSERLAGYRVAIPHEAGLRFFGDTAAENCFRRTLKQLEQSGCTLVPIDFSAFEEAGRMLFEGAYLNERYESVGSFIEFHTEQVNPTVASVILSAKQVDRPAIWRDIARLNQLRVEVGRILKSVDLLLTPTAGTIYRVDELLADPIEKNKNMAYYTNFGNLLHLSVISVPAGLRADGLPFGISLMRPGLEDETLLADAMAFEDLIRQEPGIPMAE